MAGANPPRLPPWVVLDKSVSVMEQSPAAPEGEWATVECASRTAYGCGEHGQRVLDGLTLYVRLIGRPIPDLSTALYIHANEDARRALGAELGEGDGAPIHNKGDNMYSTGVVHAADENHVVVTLLFNLYAGNRRRNYYLVYNATDTSLAMISYAPDENPVAATCTMKPLVVRGNGGGCKLVVMAERLVPPVEEEGLSTLEDILCVGTPAEDPWRVHRMTFPVKEPFAAEVMFSFQGKAFFVDLSLGIVYCDLPAAAGDCEAVVEFHYIPLPEAIPVDLKWDKTKPEDMGALYPDRTMGCVGGSIKFVCIDRTPPRRYGDAELTVWTLDPDLSKKHWHKDMGFLVRDVWRLYNFRDNPRYKMIEPKCPVLMQDGTLCLLVPNNRRKISESEDDFICVLDHNTTPLRLLWRGRIRDCRYHPPFMLPSGFFKKLSSLAPRKSELSNICVE